jgi:hypothetical protein
MIFSKPILVGMIDGSNFWEALAKPVSTPWPARIGGWGDVINAALVLIAEWGVLYWLYRRKIFFKL